MTDTHKCLNCGETMTEEQAKGTLGCPNCYSKKSIVKRSPEEVGENHQEKVVMAAKSAPKKSVPEKAAPVKAEVKAPVKPAPKKDLKKLSPAPVEAAKMAPAPVPAPKVEGAKTGKKLDAKEYAEKVKADNDALAAKKVAPATVEMSAEDKKRESDRHVKLEKAKKALNDFTKNGAPTLPADADENATKLHAHNVNAYNEYVATKRKEIELLSIPVTSQSPSAHFVKFEGGVAKKLSPEDGAKELQKAVKKQAPVAQQAKLEPICLCRRCEYIPIKGQCPKDCDEDFKKCILAKQGKKCAERLGNGDQACIDSAVRQKVDPLIIAYYKKEWGVDTKLPTKSSAKPVAAPVATKPAVKPATKKVPAKKK